MRNLSRRLERLEDQVKATEEHTLTFRFISAATGELINEVKVEGRPPRSRQRWPRYDRVSSGRG